MDETIRLFQQKGLYEAAQAPVSWGIEHHEGELAQRMAGALQRFWLARGYWSEGRRWLEESLAVNLGATPDAAARAKALYGAGTLARFQGDFARARMLCDQSLALYRALADPTGVVEALVELSRISSFQSDQTARQAFLAEAASRLETLPDTVMKASAYSEMAVAMVTPIHILYPPEAARYLAESERIHRALNNPSGLALVLGRQASTVLFGVENPLAASQLEEAERLATELGDERILSRLAGIHLLLDNRAGDFAAVRRRLQDNLRQAAGRGDHQWPTWLPVLAAVLHEQGLEVWSARVFGLAEAMTEIRPISAEAGAFWQLVHPGDIRAEVRAQLGDEVFAREMAAGKGLTLEDLQAIPYSLEPAQTDSPSASGATLTARELEVLRLLDQDLSNPQIAARLVVSRRTVDAHLRSIYDKLGIKSRDAALRVAREQRLIER